MKCVPPYSGCSGTFTIKTEATSGSETADGIKIRFNINGEWTDNVWFFDSSSRGQGTVSKTFHESDYPTEIIFDNNHSGDGWNAAKVSITNGAGVETDLGGPFNV